MANGNRRAEAQTQRTVSNMRKKHNEQLAGILVVQEAQLKALENIAGHLKQIRTGLGSMFLLWFVSMVTLILIGLT